MFVIQMETFSEHYWNEKFLLQICIMEIMEILLGVVLP